MQVFELPELAQHPDDVRFSPDGRRLAVWAFGQVVVVDTSDGTRRVVEPELVPAKWGTPRVGFTPDGRGVVYHRFRFRDTTVRVHDLETGGVRVLYRGNAVEVIAPRDDGRLVFAALHPGPTVEVVAWDPLTGGEELRFARRKGYLRELAVSPCGEWVAGAEAYDLMVWNIGGGKVPSRVAWRHKGDVGLYTGILSVSRGGRYLAVGGRRRVVWDLETGEGVVADGVAGREDGGVAFHPHRQLLAFTWNAKDAGEAVFWDPATRSDVRRFAWGVGPLHAIAFSPDGLRCAAAGKGKVVVWDADV